MTTTFRDIYATNGWNGTESLSGPGSSKSTTKRVVDALALIVELTKPLSVLNAACGDDVWTPDLPGYLGVDLVPEAIKRASRFHPHRRYQVADLRKLDELPIFDLVICRDAIQHLPLEDGVRVVDQLQRHARWLLASTYAGTDNVDIPEGDFYSPNLSAPPFDLPMPSLLIFDGYDYGAGDQVRDSRKFLGLWCFE